MKKKPKKPWCSYSLTEYQKAAQEMVHYSAKIVNSNTPAFGIRLATDFKLDLPYVAACTVDRRYMRMDYIKNAGQTSPLVNQINTIRCNNYNPLIVVPPEQVQAITSTCDDLLKTSYESSDSIGMRLRQIILQKDGQDIAATPLPCAGLNILINSRIEEEWDRENPINENGKRQNEKGFIDRKRAFLKIGGANHQNVGLAANVTAVQKPLIFHVPALDIESRTMKQALSAHYKGISIVPNISILKKFIEWQERTLAKYFTKSPTNLRIRKEEAKFLSELTHCILRRAAGVEKLLQSNIEKLPDKRLCSTNLPFVQQALIDSSLRTMEWRREFASLLHSKIISQIIWIDGQQKALNATKHGTAYWMGIIQGVLT